MAKHDSYNARIFLRLRAILSAHAINTAHISLLTQDMCVKPLPLEKFNNARV